MKVANTRKTEQISLSISKEILNRLRPVADAEGRSLSNLVQFILKRHVDVMENENVCQSVPWTLSTRNLSQDEIQMLVDTGKETL